MEIKPEELLNKIKKGNPLGQLLLVHGEDDYYRKGILKALPDYVYGSLGPEDREISRFEKDTDIREIDAAINTYPFFSGKSLVIIADEKLLNNKQDSESGKEQLEKLGKLLEDIPEYCMVVVTAVKLDKRKKLFKQLQKQGISCECNSIKTYNLGPWLDAKARELGGRLDRGAMDTIMDYLAPVENAPLQLLTGELEKLALYAGERKQWTRQDVESIFAELPDISAFSINKAIAEHNTAKVLRLLAMEKQRKTEVLSLCGMILFGLRRMTRLLELQDSNYLKKDIASMLKIPPSLYDRSLREARSYNKADLVEAILGLEQLNMDIRLGGRQYERLEEVLVRLLSTKPRGY